MVLFQYSFQLILVFVFAFLAYKAFSILSALVVQKKEERLSLKELKELVKHTTVEKDNYLKKLYSENKRALKIIENASKENTYSLRSVDKHSYQDNVVLMERRQQVSEQLAFKRALMAGEVVNRKAKILPFDLDEHDDLAQTNDK